ncbi:MAG: response regulator [Elusimicrobia bacterium]|nr:response regulator [Elusimicrobiota bacterium]
MSRRILVVDDQQNVRALVRAYLETVRKWTVVDAPDGLAALKELYAGPFDLVITDLAMPGMTGLGLLATIRRDEALKALPVVLLTSHSEEREKVKAQALGVTEYVIKPFDPKVIGPVLDRLLP